MGNSFRAVQISDNVYWVGAIDWELTDFHGYTTERGSTYNAYLVLGEKIALVDTVKAPFREEMLARINSVIHPSRIDYLISNHSEMDHTGSLPDVIREIQPEKIFASPKGVVALELHFHEGWQIETANEGDVLDLGDMKLQFLDAKMVHWPDSMFTYLDKDKILFTNDAFGMHLASMERFADEIDPWILEYEAKTYFANILWPFSAATGKVIEKVQSFSEPVEIIAPDHGPVWREKLDWIINLYRKWINHETEKKAVVVYDTMWQSTSKMAGVIADGIFEAGVDVKVLPLSRTPRSVIATELLDASAMLVGSPNLNAGLFPTVADILTYLKGLKPKNHKITGAAFGSYGWSPAATKQIVSYLEEIKADIPLEPLQVKYKPDDEILGQCFEFGNELGKLIKGS